MPRKLREALDYAAVDNLYAYDLQRVSLVAVGLSTALHRELPTSNVNVHSPIPASWFKELVKVCGGIRGRILTLNVEADYPVHRTLEAIVTHIEWLFSNSYRITDQSIEEEQFADSIYRLLRLFNLVDSSTRFIGGYDSRDAAEIAREEEEKRSALLDFVKSSPEEVVSAVFHWGRNASDRNVKITRDRKELFEIFRLIQIERNYRQGGYLA